MKVYMNIEEQIAKHARSIALATGQMAGAYRVNPGDFLDAAQRLGAKVVYGERRADEPPPGVMKMQFGGLALTLTSDNGVSPGEISRDEPAGRISLIFDLAREGKITAEQARQLLEVPAMDAEQLRRAMELLLNHAVLVLVKERTDP